MSQVDLNEFGEFYEYTRKEKMYHRNSIIERIQVNTLIGHLKELEKEYYGFTMRIGFFRTRIGDKSFLQTYPLESINNGLFCLDIQFV